MGCSRCAHCREVPLWARPEMWAAGMVCGFLLVCSWIALYNAYLGLGWLGFAVIGMLLYGVPGYLLAGHAASEIAYARLKAGASAATGRPKWTQRLASVQAKPRPEPDDDEEDDEDDSA